MNRRVQKVGLFSLSCILLCLGWWIFAEVSAPQRFAKATTASNALEVMPAQETGTLSLTLNTYLPIVQKPGLAKRMGYAATFQPITRFNEIETLLAGWYTDWTVAIEPLRPDGIEYIQMIRVHQKLACGDWFHPHRNVCPYAQPLTYVYRPDQATIEAAARANPGSLWVIGNEMDRLDWQECATWVGSQCTQAIANGQDEMLPETYASAYHDLHAFVKAADPSARIAPGGLIQATPLRLQWLTIAWDTYQTQYSQTMPVDLWNVHNFILREVKNAYGAAIPPGLPGDPSMGEYSNSDWTHIDRTIFDKQIRAFRQWMKARGEQEKPLIVSEYGVLYRHCAEQQNGVCVKDLGNEAVTHDFMQWTFDYYRTTRDCEVGLTIDDCRLVQRWLWFALDTTRTNTNGQIEAGINPHVSLMDAGVLEVRRAGELFRQYTNQYLAELQYLAEQQR